MGSATLQMNDHRGWAAITPRQCIAAIDELDERDVPAMARRQAN